MLKIWPDAPFPGACEITITDTLTGNAARMQFPAVFSIYADYMSDTPPVCSVWAQTTMPLEQEVVSFVIAQCGAGWDVQPIAQRLRAPYAGAPHGTTVFANLFPPEERTRVQIDILEIDLHRS